MNKLIPISICLAQFFISLNRAQAQFPHEVLLQCTVKMQRMGFEKSTADEACAISAGESCSELQAAVVQGSFPNCVGDLIYEGVKPIIYAMQFCNMAAARSTQCVPQRYIVQRELFAACVSHDKRNGADISQVLNRCLEKVLLGR